MKKRLILILSMLVLFCYQQGLSDEPLVMTKENLVQKSSEEVALSAKEDENAETVKLKIVAFDNTILTEKADFTENITALELTKELLTKNNIPFDYSGSEKNAYIKGIAGFFEKGYGANSGWLYFVNGEPAMLSADQCKLNAGDELIWHYYENCFDSNLVP